MSSPFCILVKRMGKIGKQLEIFIEAASKRFGQNKKKGLFLYSCLVCHGHSRSDYYNWKSSHGFGKRGIQLCQNVTRNVLPKFSYCDRCNMMKAREAHPGCRTKSCRNLKSKMVDIENEQLLTKYCCLCLGNCRVTLKVGAQIKVADKHLAVQKVIFVYSFIKIHLLFVRPLIVEPGSLFRLPVQTWT